MNQARVEYLEEIVRAIKLHNVTKVAIPEGNRNHYTPELIDCAEVVTGGWPGSSAVWSLNKIFYQLKIDHKFFRKYVKFKGIDIPHYIKFFDKTEDSDVPEVWVEPNQKAQEDSRFLDLLGVYKTPGKAAYMCVANTISPIKTTPEWHQDWVTKNIDSFEWVLGVLKMSIETKHLAYMFGSK